MINFKNIKKEITEETILNINFNFFITSDLFYLYTAFLEETKMIGIYNLIIHKLFKIRNTFL